MTLFRRRFGYVPAGTPIVDDAPTRARGGVAHLLESLASLFGATGAMGHYYLQRFLLRSVKRSDIEPIANPQWTSKILNTCGWIEFYEMIEAVAAYLKTYDEPRQSDNFSRFRAAVNQNFDEENVGYESSPRASRSKT